MEQQPTQGKRERRRKGKNARRGEGGKFGWDMDDIYISEVEPESTWRRDPGSVVQGSFYPQNSLLPLFCFLFSCIECLCGPISPLLSRQMTFYPSCWFDHSHRKGESIQFVCGKSGDSRVSPSRSFVVLGSTMILGITATVEGSTVRWQIGPRSRGANRQPTLVVHLSLHLITILDHERVMMSTVSGIYGYMR